MKRAFSLLLAAAILCSVSAAFAADPVPVTSVTVSPESASIPIRKNITLKTVIEPKNATMKGLTWTSSDESVATVSKTGQVTGVSAGTATITATAADGSGVSATMQVTVVNPVTRITPEQHTITLAPETCWTIYWTVEPADATNPAVTWKSSNEKVVTVNENGILRALSAGNATVTGAATDGSGTKAAVNVIVKAHDIVITEPGDLDVEFETEEANVSITLRSEGKTTTKSCDRKFKTANGCVSSPENMVIRPVKAGSDTISIVYMEKKKPVKTETYKVFVAPAAVGISASLDENGEPAPIRFLDIPWGSNYPQALNELAEDGRVLKDLSQRNTYLRAMLEGEVLFGNITAFSAAVNFTYTQGDRLYESRNALFKGDLYFDPELPVENVVRTVKTVYGLGEARQNGDEYYWERDHIRVVLTKKSRFTILEIIWDGTEIEDETAEAPAEEEEAGEDAEETVEAEDAEEEDGEE